MENKYWKPKLTDENEHLCMENTKWEEKRPSWDYVNMKPYHLLENGDIDLFSKYKGTSFFPKIEN